MKPVMNDNSEATNLPPVKPGRGRHGPRSIPDTRHAEETKQKAVQMFMAGQRPWKIAKELGVNFHTCYSWLEGARRELARAAVSDGDHP